MSEPAPALAGTGAARVVRLGLLGAVLAAVVVGGLQLVPNSAGESGHQNWPAVRDASRRPPGEIRWQDRSGATLSLSGIPIGDEDRDDATTLAVGAALAAGDDVAVARAIGAAQVPGPLPTVVPGTAAPAATPAPAQGVVPAPALAPEIKAELRSKEAQFVRLFLYDCCDEDGDVVDVLVDGQLFATVRLTNHGVTLSAPVSVSRATKIQIRGAHDGGGGITVGCRTSKGHGFLRILDVGEVETLAVLRK